MCNQIKVSEPKSQLEKSKRPRRHEILHNPRLFRDRESRVHDLRPAQQYIFPVFTFSLTNAEKMAYDKKSALGNRAGNSNPMNKEERTSV
jgi:hypothetical protein